MKPYLTKWWFARWWWYTHTRRKYRLHILRIGRFHAGVVSYRIAEEQ